jgi:polysaccharide export outer membrane protein
VIGSFAAKAVAAASILALGLSSSGCSTSSSSAQPVDALQLASTGGAQGGSLRVVSELPPPAQNGGEQPISPNDVLQVDVFQVDNLDRTVQVDATGKISLPLVGSVQAAGRTARQLEEEIETAYGAKYLQSPDVTIFVKESVGQRITIDGEVAKAGIYPVSSNSSLLDAIALAGGFRDIADASKVYVYRDYAAGKLVANYDVAQIRAGKKPNPRIYGGDVIVVFTSSSKVAIRNLKEAMGVASSATRLAVIP